MAVYHDSTNLIIQDGSLVCEWDGCQYDAMPYHLDNGGRTWTFDQIGSCHAWARGVALDEIRSCEPRYGLNGEIWTAPGPEPDQ